MRILYFTDGVAGYVPPGFSYPVIVGSDGRVIPSVDHYTLDKVATNAWRSPLSARSGAQRLVDVLAYFEDNSFPLTLATVETLTLYRNFKLNIGIDGIPCSQRSTNQAVAQFRDFWDFAIRHGYVEETGLVSILDYKSNTAGIPAFNNLRLPTAEEISSFMSALGGPEERLATPLMFAAGLRRAEVVSLPHSIILPLSEMVRDEDVVLLTLDGTRARTKGFKTRTVEIPVRLYTALYQYKICGRRADRAERALTASDALLLSPSGNSYKPGWLNDFFARANIVTQHFHPHLFRHWYATRFIEYDLHARFKGSETKAYRKLQLLLGHSFLETTLLYAHIVIDQVPGGTTAISLYQRKLDEIIEEVGL